MKKMLSIILTSVISMTVFATMSSYAQDFYVMKIVTDGETTYYNDFAEGWTTAVTLAKTNKTIVTLGKDWLAGDTNNNGIIDGSESAGSFLYYRNNVECGTIGGSLLVNGNSNLTIDLNGHTINRGLTNEKESGQVFTVTEGAKLTVNDTSANATGVITGGKNSGNGGGFYVDNRATLTLNGGKICRNYGKQGGGVYVCNALFYMNSGSVEYNSAEYGGGIALDKKSSADREYIVCKGGKIYQNDARLGGGVYVSSAREDAVITFENTEISNNFADDAGGGVYTWFNSENGEVLFGEGTIIRQNTSGKGGAVYVGNGSLKIISARIEFNKAFSRCGGVGMDDDLDDNAHGTIIEYGKYTLGGSTYIQDNFVQSGWYEPQINSNLHIGDITCDLYHDVNNPLTSGASIGIDMYADFGIDETEEKLSDAKGDFAIDSYKYFTIDNPDYIIAARDGGSEGKDRYQIYVQMAENALDGGIKGAILKPAFKSNTTAFVQENDKILTLTVNPTMKGCLENSSLYNVAEFSYAADVVGIADGDKIKNLFDEQWQVMAKNNYYELWQIKIIPYGGEWSDEDGSAARVTVDGVTKHYADFESAWIDALDASTKKDTLLVLNKDWYAGDSDADGIIDASETKGYFKVEKNGSEYGTNKGRLYLNDNIRLTIDLNGHTISRNLTESVDNGQVFSLQDQDIVLTIKDSVGGGKITGGNNKGNGGAFFVYNGNLNFEGGEISGNKAENGAGIYWESRNNLCVYGGTITQNKAVANGGGIYGTDWGKMYFGGTIAVKGNTGSSNSVNNVYLESDDVYINHTAGQGDNIPNVSFKDGAYIGIRMPDTEKTILISGENSLFDSEDFAHFYGDNAGYFVRAVFDEFGKNNIHKLYYNKWGHADAVYPKIKSVAARENNGLISEAYVDVDKQIITLKAISSDRRLFKSVVVEKLVSFVTSNDADVYWRFCDVAFDLSKPMEYKVVSKSTGTYVHCRVVVEFPECMHNDSDGNYICDYCEEYIFKDFTIAGYNAQTKEATVFVTEPGKYTVIFVDYENKTIKNVDMVEYEFTKGINTVFQNNKNFMLTSGDKVLLWYDMANLVPVGDVLIVN